MSSTDTRCRVYGPEAIETLGWAFDKALEGLSRESKRQPNMRRDLALCILRLFDSGENKPLRLSRKALAVVTDFDRTACSNTIGVFDRYFVVVHEDQWKISHNKKHEGPFDSEAAATRVAVVRAKHAVTGGCNSQVMVRGEDNSFQEAWTYLTPSSQ
jgi:hypothetical protein